jgi:hypothetical protein
VGVGVKRIGTVRTFLKSQSSQNARTINKRIIERFKNNNIDVIAGGLNLKFYSSAPNKIIYMPGYENAAKQISSIIKDLRRMSTRPCVDTRNNKCTIQLKPGKDWGYQLSGADVYIFIK